jgi:hypothetical protein
VGADDGGTGIQVDLASRRRAVPLLVPLVQFVPLGGVRGST